jgi:hypothetical protein
VRLQPLAGAVADANFSFACDATDLAAYARVHLGPMTRPAAARPAVSTVLRWHDAQPPVQRPCAESESRLLRVDRDLYISGDELDWFRVDDLRDLHLHFTWREGRLAVCGDFYHRLGNTRLSDRVRRVATWPQRAQWRRRRFTTLLYYLVYYPCWWWLEQTEDLHPLHAAAVSTEAGVILLAGASGIGKSSLTMALTASGARMLADSFVMHRNTDVCAVREPVLLDEWSRRWLGAAADFLRPIDGHYGLQRRGYLLPAERMAERGRAVLLVLPRRSSQAYVKGIGAEEAHQRVSALDLIINDLRRYWAFAAVLEQLAPRGLMARREAHLAGLTAAVPAFEIGLTPDTTSAAAAEMILDLAAQPSRQPSASARVGA